MTKPDQKLSKVSYISGVVVKSLIELEITLSHSCHELYKSLQRRQTSQKCRQNRLKGTHLTKLDSLLKTTGRLNHRKPVVRFQLVRSALITLEKKRIVNTDYPLDRPVYGLDLVSGELVM